MDLQKALAEPITTAGTADAAPSGSPRKNAIRLIRTALRAEDATDEEVDGALEALLELARE